MKLPENHRMGMLRIWPNIKLTTPKGENIEQTKKKAAANINWFEIPADDLERRRSSTAIVGWKINSNSGNGGLLEH